MAAFDAYGDQLYPNIYVDGNYVGTGYAQLQVMIGPHTIAVDGTTWNGNYGCDTYFNFYADYVWDGNSWVLNGNIWDNPLPVYIDTDTVAVAYYYP